MHTHSGTSAPRFAAAGANRSPWAPSPALPLGPFYPLDPPAGATPALWLGGPPPSGTRALRLQGCVRSVEGRLVSGARVEIWHADPAGRYHHPSAPDAEQVLAGFSGYGRVDSDAEGRFEFTSLVPGGYGSAPAWRAPHLHVQITGTFDRLVTQLFLPGNADNAADRWLRTLRQPQALMPDVVRDDDTGLALRWTAVLTRG